MPSLTYERLRKLLDYDPITGIFRWKGNSGWRRGIAGSITDKGYITIRVDGRPHRASNLAWFYMTGEWPPEEVDHENRIRADNVWTNLRLATRSQNLANSNASSGASGLRGVRLHGKRWRAKITVNYKVIPLGIFDTKEEAHLAYLQARRKYFGEYSPQ